MKKTHLVKQEFVIFKEGEDNTELETIQVNFYCDPLTSELTLEIIEGKNKITLYDQDAKAFKKVIESTNFIFRD